MVPAGANRKAEKVGSDDDAVRLAQCIVDAVLCVGAGFTVVNALDSTDMGELVVMRGCMVENRAPLPEPCQAFAAKAAVPRIVTRRRRSVYLELILNGRTVRALDMAGR